MQYQKSISICGYILSAKGIWKSCYIFSQDQGNVVLAFILAHSTIIVFEWSANPCHKAKDIRNILKKVDIIVE